ncbi:MAG TPA: hypothetical protein EYH25_04270 [Thermotoga sp.]|nr:hypothetical protein [Thermotoga sp.]
MDWWKELENWAEEMGRKYKVDIELFNAEKDKWAKGKPRYHVKIGIWPWGATFLYGTLEELESYIKEVVENYINPKNYKCPFCKKRYSLRELRSEEKFQCSCGSILLVSEWKNGFTLHENSAFNEILENLPNFERETVSLYIFEYSFYVEDVFKNVIYTNVEGWPSYWIKGKPVVRKEYEIEQRRPVEFKLIKNGYRLIEKSRKQFCSLWENEEGHKIGVDYDIDNKPQTIWIECKGILTREEIWAFEETTKEDFINALEEELGEISAIPICDFEFIQGLPVDAEEFEKRNLSELLKELEGRFSEAQFKVLKKYRIRLDELKERAKEF